MSGISDKEKTITIKDVAKKAGVSQATVGRVIGGYGSVSELTREKVLKAAKEIHYVPNAIAQSMKRKSTKTIGVVIGNIENLFFGQMVRSIEDYASEYGYNVIICNTSENPTIEINAIKILLSKQVDGIIISTCQPSNKVFSEEEKKLYLDSTPKIFADREMFGINELCVKTDHFGGAYEAVNYLIKKGHRHIAVVAGLKVSTMEQRIEGCKKAASDNNIELNNIYIGLGDTMSIEDGAQITKELILNNPKITAVFVLNDLLSMGALKTIFEMRLEIPDDISFIGWDDFPLAEIYRPPLTMITQETNKIGEVAIKRLLDMISEGKDGHDTFYEKRITLKTRLIERESCGKIEII